jgi:CRISPR-associated endoribonuclease Cas6
VRVRVIFLLKNRGEYLPFHYQGVIHSFLRQLSLTREIEYDISFSSLKGQIRISRKGLHYCSKRVTLVLSSVNKASIEALLEVIFSQDVVQIGQLKLEPEYAEREIEPDYKEIVKYICLSPIILKELPNEEGKAFISPEDEAFSDLVYESTLLRMQRAMKLSQEDLEAHKHFQLIPDSYYLDKIREKEKKFARIYTLSCAKGERELRGYTFPFTLYASPAVQRFVFLQGLGSCTSNGFGMLDLAHNDPTSRTELLREYSKENYQASSNA